MDFGVGVAYRKGLFIFYERPGRVVAVIRQIGQQQMSAIRIGISCNGFLERLTRKCPTGSEQPIVSRIVGRAMKRGKQAVQSSIIFSEVEGRYCPIQALSHRELTRPSPLKALQAEAIAGIGRCRWGLQNLCQLFEFAQRCLRLLR